MARLALKLYNTRSRSEEVFEPLDPPRVRMYHCGPTVYNYAHIGNLSAWVFADILRRVIEYAGYEVTQVMNITDVGHLTVDDVADARGEDKLEAAARRENRTPWDLARHYTRCFFADLEALGIKAAHYYPRATEFVPEMIELIQELEKNGFAYRAGADVYFDISRFPAYGALSGNTLEKLEAGARVEVREEKRSPHDFALWKTDPKHIMQWPSPWGRGFPGWHIECSAMARRFLGDSFDIHTGGEDNIFPHHECEIAQSEGATGKPFVRYWLHTRFLLVDGKKMSKSLGNFYTLRDIEAKGYSPRELRYLFISTHYRTQPNFTFEGLDAARRALERLDRFVEKVSGEAAGAGGEATADLSLVMAARRAFDDAVAADLNISLALGAIFELVREGNKRVFPPGEADAVLGFLRDVDQVLGVLFWTPLAERRGSEAPPARAAGLAEAEAQALLDRREAARKAKDFATSDRLRDELRKGGWVVEDTPRGPRLKRA
jgi:cysteinyl-tRNA synthetase